MKKIVLVSLALFCTLLSFGRTVPLNTAKLTGYHFLQQKLGSDVVPDVNSLILEYTSRGSTGVFGYYVFNVSHGFVMVSGEDAIMPILAYSTTRNFNSGHLPPSVSAYIGSYQNQAEFVVTRNISASPEVSAKWNTIINNIPETRARTTVVAPLLSSTWNQNPYYNDSCPYDGASSSLCVTGCVATATSQVMRFWNWPNTGTGTHSYTAGIYGTLSANFGATSYNWSAMPLNVTSPNAAVAQLLYHVGIAVDMSYGPASTGGSGAYVVSSWSGGTNCAEYALKTYFNYSTALQGLRRWDYSDAAWIALIKADLDLGHPIVYAGSGSAGGHCWVVDGYDISNNLHCNWGWAGAGPDGYYSMNAMNPPALGTGGGGGGFDTLQMAIVGIVPNLMPINGTLTVCAGSTTSLSDATTGGTWSSSAPGTASVSSSGLVTGHIAGTATISYTVAGSSSTAVVTVNPLPTVAPISGGGVLVCGGTSRTLTDATTGGGWSVSSSGIGTIGSGSGIFTSVSAGTVIITYSVSNSCGTTIATTTLTVSPAVSITSAPSVTPPGTTPCAGSTASYFATVFGATSYVWAVSGTSWSGTSTTGILSAGVGTGVGQIIVYGTNACGNGPADTLHVTPTALPTTPSVTLSGSIPCTGASSATYNATSIGATSYNWTVLGSSWTGSSTTASIVVGLGTGIGTLICSGVNACGTSSATTTALTASPLPSTPTVSLVGSIPCLGATSAVYNSTCLGATSYSWTVLGTGWSGSSSTSTLNVTIGSGATGTIICHGINTCGAGTADTVYLTPSSGLAGASVIVEPTSICEGSTATFTTPSIPGATGYTWIVAGTGWSGSSSTNSINLTVGTAPATITVYGYNSCGHGASYTISGVVPVAPPTSNFSIANHVTAYGVNDLITYTGTGLSTASYSWNFGGGTIATGSGSGPYNVSWATTGLKTVSLSVTESGCTSGVTRDTVLVVSTTELGEMIAQNSNVAIYPNPNTGIFDIVFGITGNYPVSIKLSDVQGRVVYSNEFDTINNKLTINTSNLSNGIYTATIVTGGAIFNRKVVVSK